MAKLTWLGTEDYREGESPLESCTWNGVLFTAFDKVDVFDEWMIAKARGNRFFKVEEEPYPVPVTQWRSETEADPADVSFFDDPPEVMPPDYPPEDEPDRTKKRRGRPPRIRENANGD